MFIKPFVVNIGIQFAFMAEIMAGIIVIEKVAGENWVLLWLETNSKLLTLAFTNLSFLPWYIFTRWMNFINLANSSSVCLLERCSWGTNIIGMPPSFSSCTPLLFLLKTKLFLLGAVITNNVQSFKHIESCGANA